MDYAASPFQFKAIDDAGVIEGLAASYSLDHGGDLILPGAMAKALAENGGRPMPMLLHHDQKRPIGAWTELRETPDGLFAKGRLTLATRDAQEAHALARDGALTGLSIGYLTVKHSYAGQVRQLHEIAPKEASLVAVPMNDLTRVHSVKAITSPADIEALLHDVGGLSVRKAKVAASAAWRAISDSDDEAEAEARLSSILNTSAARIAAATRGTTKWIR